MRPQYLTENSVLLGSPAQITEILKKVEAAGFDEVILYFNAGLKAHAQVKTRWAGSWPRSRPPSREAASRQYARLSARRRR